ncbi:hypothetical protein [Streptomyces sp. NPDC056468]|uniref:hypothetical protein n=1 Tax=Streptomyces sp. NPDC056468 TaxID=3345830 RepID=UPI0036845742
MMASAVRAFAAAISASEVPPVTMVSMVISAISRFIIMNSRSIWYLDSASFIESEACPSDMFRSSPENFPRWFVPESSTNSFTAAINSLATAGGIDFPAEPIAPCNELESDSMSSASRL